MWTVQAAVLLTLVQVLSASEKDVCDKGWFGSACQFQCHCTRKKCDSHGQCVGGADCRNGWFGPACQYEDLVHRGTVTTNQGTIMPEITDGDSSTCIPDIFLQSVTVTWNMPYPVTWIRIHVEDPALLHNITVQFRNSSSAAPFYCPHQPRHFMFSEKVLDILCLLTAAVQQVILTGEGVKSLCSLHISGGRNLALKQSTSQSSTLLSSGVTSGSENAVDGNTNGDWNDGSCTHTDFIDPDPKWKIRFSRPTIINRFVLYNRLDSNNSQHPEYYKDLLRGFTLKSYNKYESEVFSYTDSGTVADDVYTVTSADVASPTFEVAVHTRMVVDGGRVLSLCEVELYGESDCPPGQHGLECEKKCNCAVKNEACFVSTGGCLSGCAAGYQGEGCAQPCAAGKYGVDCRENCSVFCGVKSGTNQSVCHHVHGQCLHRCKRGYEGPSCSAPCSNMTFGEGCRERCCRKCGGDSSCHHVTGHCLHGCREGYTGPTCAERCGPDSYGKGCNLTCSPFCLKDDNETQISSCHHVTGNCLYGCRDGYEGLQCGQLHLWNDNSGIGSEIIIGIALSVALFVTISLITLCYILHKVRNGRRATANEEIPPGYDNVQSLRTEYKPMYRKDDHVLEKMLSALEALPIRKGSITDEQAVYEGSDTDHYDVIKDDKPDYQKVDD